MFKQNESYKSYIGSREDQISLRSVYSLLELSSESNGFVESLELLIEGELLRIVIEAHKESDLYWAVVRNSIDDYIGWERFCRIGTRVVYKNNSFSIEWFRNRYVDQGDGKPKKVYSTYITKGKGFRYSMSKFKNEPTWVQEQVAASEEKFSMLRERAYYLVKLRTALRTYKRRCAP